MADEKNSFKWMLDDARKELLYGARYMNKASKLANEANAEVRKMQSHLKTLNAKLEYISQHAGCLEAELTQARR